MQDPYTHPNALVQLLRELPRVAGIAAVWLSATAMLALCIWLAPATHSGIVLPVLTLLAALLGTALVSRRRGEEPSRRLRTELAETHRRLAAVEQRLASLETIDRFEAHLAEKAMAGSGETTERPLKRETPGLGAEAIRR